MKKIFTQKMLLILLLTLGATLAVSETKAQCRYVVISSPNDSTVFDVPADFPVKKQASGNPAADDSLYAREIQAWNLQSLVINGLVLPTSLSAGVKQIIIFIPSSEFNLFSDDRKKSISLYPDIYKVTSK